MTRSVSPSGRRRRCGSARSPALVQQRPQQADCEQRVALRALHEPVHQRAWRRALDHRLGQLTHARAPERGDLHARNERVLVELEQHLGGDVVTSQLGGSARREHEQPGVVMVAREIAQRLPRRRIRVVHVVEHDHERPAARDVAEQTGESMQQARKRGIALGHRAAHERDAMQQGREIVEEPTAQLHDLLVRKRAQERVHRLGPQPERRARRQRIRLGGESGHLPMTRHQLAGEPTLADPGIAQQQDEPELTGPRAAELVLERRELSPPPDQLRAQTPRSSGRQHHGTDRVWSARRSKSSPSSGRRRI